MNVDPSTIAALAPVILAFLLFEVYCLVDIARRDVRRLPRWAWYFVVLLSIPLGGVAYLLLGRGDRHEQP